MQLELTKTAGKPNQTCAAINMLDSLERLGFVFKQGPNSFVHSRAAPEVGSWVGTGPWKALPSFPSESSRRAARKGPNKHAVWKPPMMYAFHRDFGSFSTNLIGQRFGDGRAPRSYTPRGPHAQIKC